MNADVRRRWVAALRSGDYRQGQGKLHRTFADDRPDAYCCLGVLCALAAADGVVRSSVPVTELDAMVVAYDGHNNYLPHVVSEWAGLASDDPIVLDAGLSRWNDGEVYDVDSRSFDWIADAIEEHL